MSISGLEGLVQDQYVEVSSGGEQLEWISFNQRKFYTNAFIVEDGKVGRCKLEGKTAPNSASC